MNVWLVEGIIVFISALVEVHVLCEFFIVDLASLVDNDLDIVWISQVKLVEIVLNPKSQLELNLASCQLRVSIVEFWEDSRRYGGV